MLKVVVIGYDKMLSSLISGVIASNNKVVGVLRNERVKINKFLLFFKDIFAPSKDLSFIKSYKLNDIKAGSVNSKEFLNEVKKLEADVILVGSWGEKIKGEILNTPKYGIINCHPSLLPKNRGANPYFWVLYQGKKETGVTFHKVDKNYDTGDILFQAKVAITPEMNALDLKNKCAQTAKLMVPSLLNDLENNRIIPTPQNEAEATYEFAYTANHIVIDYTRSIEEILNHIRALLPYQTPYVMLNDYYHKVGKYKISDGKPTMKNGKVLKCKDGFLEVEIL
jgi:methionyl-tRNA formyltransferase